MADDWTKLFGSIDVGIGGTAPAPKVNSAPKAAPQPPAPQPLAPQPPAGPTPAASTGTAPQVRTSAGTQQVAPGVFQMAASFGTSMAKFAAGGFRTTGTELHQRRLAVCDDCQYRGGTTCLLCGCILPLKAKMPHEQCPVGKWPG